MKIWDILKTANANLLRNKGRSFLTILAIFIGSFTIIMTTGINTAVNSYIDKQVESAGAEGYLEIMPDSTAEMMEGLMGGGGLSEPREYDPNSGAAGIQTITKEDLEKIKKVKGIQSVKGAGEASAQYITSSKTTKKYKARIHELPTDRIHIDMATGKMVDLDSNEPQIALTPGMSKVLGYDKDSDIVGKKVTLGIEVMATKQLKEVEATVVGVQNKTIISMGRMAINHALFEKISDIEMAGMPAQYRNLVYYASAEYDPKMSEKDVDQMKSDLKKIGFAGMTVNDQVGMVKSFFDAITTILTIFGVIALLAASIGIINTLFMAVQERTREIGLMKAMGLGKGKIYIMFSFEAIALGFWGAAIGVGLALVARIFANQLARETFLKALPGFTLVEFDPLLLVAIVAIVMAIAFLAGSMPARRAAKKDPIEALRYE
ncbi:FtsX-like permease family protein [Candidatus Saccharibacteria bacterium]|nr:FtsX-like permease family protein [Candidatus Saccharibacteria bacterium]MCL1962964.1 FtsX-like permease family protein [Candidatus Saccharibacteria bacterium]